ncbi:MAG: phenylacetate-CoA oxygenase subunit PaaJ [Bacteroidetes bacterium]|nr:phenylacetate-CoA oxygenase subunit PaaJ [Bacteroidota bacterium]
MQSTQKTVRGIPDVLTTLGEVLDPEIPVLDIVAMGIVTSVEVEPDATVVTIAPTYSGCPAMRMIENDIIEVLTRKGFPHPQVKISFARVWSTDDMTEEGRAKLRDYGIAPPAPRPGEPGDPADVNRTAACPYCGSSETMLKSFFGSTACKSLHYCNDCLQPFEAFKCI